MSTDRVSLVEVFSDRCSLWRYRCPVELIAEALAQEGSRYSPEFDVGGVSWRLHLQHRTAPQSSEVYLAIHLQCCSSRGAYGHFKITVCNRDASQNKSKTFHCHFKKAGSAWGLHHFVALDTLLSPDRGFIDNGTWGGTSSKSANLNNMRYVVIDVIIQVLEPGLDGSYSLGMLPQPSVAAAGPPAGSRPRYEQSESRGPSITRVPLTLATGGGALVPQQAPPTATYQDPLTQAYVKASLVYPFEHLESLSDMWFDVNGVRINTHRCVIAARMAALLPGNVLPLQPGVTVKIDAPMEVFSAFLKYVYTEDYPEAGVLHAAALLDLYLLAAQCEFFDLCGVCLRLARPLLNAENILPIVLSRYNAADDVLTAMYLRVLLDHYDLLITDKQFEEIPGHLFRRLSLILRDKEKLPAVVIPSTKNTLGKQLALLAESGDYSDVELPVSATITIKAHKYILASRSVVISQAYHPRAAGTPSSALPSFQVPEFQFTARAWSRALACVYRRHVESAKDLSAEDISILFKLHSSLAMDGNLKREADSAVTSSNALRVLIFAVKHQISDLKDRAMTFVGGHFSAMIRADAAAWDVISELPQPSVVTLLRLATDAASDVR